MCYFIIEGTLAQERVQLHNIRQDLERRHQALIRHLTTLDATILGILAVFLDKQQTSLFPLSPTVVGTSLLFLSLVSGIYYICMIHRQAVKVYRHLCAEVEGVSHSHLSAADSPFGSEFAALFCPISLCLGLLSFLVGVFLYVFAFPCSYSLDLLPRKWQNSAVSIRFFLFFFFFAHILASLKSLLYICSVRDGDNLQRPALIPARLFSLAFLLALFYHCVCSIFFRISCIGSCF